jgi:glycerophosphoryl diester phosphodiesterase
MGQPVKEKNETMKKVMVMLAVMLAGVAAQAEQCLNGGRGSGGNKTDLLHLSHVHRGGGKLESPDNTLETFKWCWENGSALECDCRKTKDGVGIMLHDDTLARTARGIPEELKKKSVSKELTWDEIKDVDVGSYLSPKFAHHRIPTIDATFAAMKGNPTYLCFVDEKGAGPEYIAKKAQEAGVQDQVYYTGPSHAKIFEWNKILPGGKSLLWLGAWPKGRSAAERTRTDTWFRDAMAKLRAKEFKYISAVSIHTYYDPKDPVDPFIPSTPLLKEMVNEFHSHGIPVASIPFAGGETEEVYFKLYDLGFDAFSTDYPSVMFSVIRKLKAGKRE